VKLSRNAAAFCLSYYNGQVISVHLNRGEVMSGFGIFEPIGLKTEFVYIDLDRHEVEADVLYNERKIMTVSINLKEMIVQKTGGYDEFPRLKEMGITEQDTILEIQLLGQMYIENGITNPKEYYERFK
jgi:hypothetical protein